MITLAEAALPAALRRAWAAALADFDLAARVRATISRSDHLHAPKPWRAFAIGKAALAMMEGALEGGLAFEEAIVIMPEGLDDARSVIERSHATAFIGSHPIPDERSKRAGAALLALAERTSREGGTIFAFVSGGASALACVPCAGVDVATKARVTSTLLASGADVRAINTVRRHLSGLKGGGVLRAAGAAAVHTFVVSDVLGGEAHDVGSGLSVIDPTTVEDARIVLERFAPELAFPRRGSRSAPLPLVETTKAADVIGREMRTSMVADARDFAAHVCAKLTAEGFVAKQDEGALESGARGDALLAEIREAAKTMGAGEALVRCVEPSFTVTTNRGGGGRATHLAAMVASELPDQFSACLVGATDGVDGGSGTGGAIVTRRSAERAGPSLATSIAQFAAAACLARVDATLPAGPTGLNFADVLILARRPRPGRLR